MNDNSQDHSGFIYDAEHGSQVTINSRQTRRSISKREKLVILCVLGSAIAVALLISLAPASTRSLYQNSTIQITSSSAFALSIVAYLRIRRRVQVKEGVRQVGENSAQRTLFFLLAGIASWFCAESIWNYYVYVLGVEIPYPSIADIFYLAGYPFFGFSMYRLAKNQAGERYQESKFIATAVIITIVAFVINLFLLQIVESSIGFSVQSQSKLLALVLSLAYPILDAILIVPSILILYGVVRNHTLMTASLVLLASAMILEAVADTGFGYTAIYQSSLLADTGTWDILFNISYILICGSLVSGSILSVNPDIRKIGH